jgi:hypothetical protein
VLLVFCTADHGGLADYAHAQCEALAQHSSTVLLLAPLAFRSAPAFISTFISLGSNRKVPAAGCSNSLPPL